MTVDKIPSSRPVRPVGITHYEMLTDCRPPSNRELDFRWWYWSIGEWLKPAEEKV